METVLTSVSTDYPEPSPRWIDLRFFRLTIAVVWTVVIMVLCWLPGPMIREIEGDSSWFKIPNLDKVVHCGIFVLFSILWARLGTSRRRLTWIAVAGFCLAVITEVVQKLAIVGRDGRLDDTIMDFIGILVGIAVASRVEPLFLFFESRLFGATASDRVTVPATSVTVDDVTSPSS